MKLNEKSKGLGDTIEKFTTATGIKNVITKVTKAAGVNDCGCGQRIVLKYQEQMELHKMENL